MGLHRLVAVAVSPEELRPGSDLVARLTGAEQVDLLVITDGDHDDGDRDDGYHDGGDHDGGDHDDGDHDDEPLHPGDQLRILAGDLNLPQLAVHRLGLPAPPHPRDVDDVVAAISELVGFDPEPGVGCVIPLGLGDTAAGSDPTDPADVVIGQVMARIVAAYRLPVLTYARRTPG